MEFDPADLSTSQRYKLLIGCIVPRPIAFVSTVSTDGAPNLAPFSFFNGVGSEPMSLLFCPAARPDGGEKDTLRNCKPVEEGGTGQFVVNGATEAYARKVAAAAEPLEHGQSEFELVGLAAEPSVKVAPPRVAESPFAFECETIQVIRLSGVSNIVIGRVVYVHVLDEALNDRFHVDPEAVKAVGRMGGFVYCTTSGRFELPMGVSALDP